MTTMHRTTQTRKFAQAHTALYVKYRRNERSKARFCKPEERVPVTPIALESLSFIYAAPSRYR